MIVMNKGKLYREGTPEEIFQMDEELIASRIRYAISCKNEQAIERKGY